MLLFFFPAILILTMKIMIEVHFQVLYPGKLLALDPKMRTDQLLMLAGNIIHDPCSQAQNLLLLHIVIFAVSQIPAIKFC